MEVVQRRRIAVVIVVLSTASLSPSPTFTSLTTSDILGKVMQYIEVVQRRRVAVVIALLSTVSQMGKHESEHIPGDHLFQP
ncbi:hypothetical protein J6590_090355 [Homalodisca vitripennis]|nr:hypothetical protein J6590_090355 [Homalodisca vitripennis]